MADSRRAERLLVCVALACTAATAASPDAPARPLRARAAAACKDVTFIGARGSGEKQSEGGGMGKTVRHMADHLSLLLSADGQSMGMVAVDYPALGTETMLPSKSMLLLPPPAAAAAWYKKRFKKYIGSIDQGIAAVKNTVFEQLSTCPDTLMVLGGYSQGAMAIHQALLDLADGGEEDALDLIAGSLLLGDGDRASSSAAKLFGDSPRDHEGVRNYFNANDGRDVQDPEITVEICDANDIVCDFNASRIFKAASFVKVHTSYLKGNSKNHKLDRAVEWLANRELIFGD